MSELTIGLRSSGSDHNGGYGISFNGMTKEEHDKLLSCIQFGIRFVRVNNGRLEFKDAYEDLPKATDETMLPFWKPETNNTSRQIELFNTGEAYAEIRKTYSPCLYISSICGYNYSKENYKNEAEKLESYGFECMRSRRGVDGKFWEVWVLNGFYAAEGDFKDFISSITDNVWNDFTKEQIDMVIRYLCRKTSFGSLNMTFQRACMVID